MIRQKKECILRTDESFQSSLHSISGSDAFAAQRLALATSWWSVDSAWEEEKPEVRKMLINAAESHTSGARFVRRLLL